MKRLLPLVFAAACVLYADAPTPIAIRNAKVVPVSGPAIARGTVIVRNGLIEDVGANINIPPDAWVIEGDGLTVYPGLIDSLSTIGIPEFAPAPTPAGGAAGGAAGRGAAPATATPATAASAPAPTARGPEDRPSTTSWLRAADMVKNSDRRLETARNAGFASAIVFPTRGIFAGQGVVINLAGDNAGQMVVTNSVGQYVTFANGGFGSGFPASLMGAISYVRQVYLDADRYHKAKRLYAAQPRGTARPEYDRALEGVLESPRTLLPAARRVDVDRMIHFASELKLKPVLYGLPEGYKSADLLKSSGVPVLVSLKWPARSADADPEQTDTLQTLELRENAPSTPAVLAKNGVKFALYAEGGERRADLYKAVKKAIDAGLSPDDALKAMTLSPAEIFGVADRLGSIEKGKIANLVVTKGDLFQDKTEVKYVFVDGNKFEPVEEPVPAGGPRPGGEGNRPTPAPEQPQGEKQ